MYISHSDLQHVIYILSQGVLQVLLCPNIYIYIYLFFLLGGVGMTCNKGQIEPLKLYLNDMCLDHRTPVILI